MKKICVIALLFAGIVGVCLGFSRSGKEGEAAYLRVHIRANSNSEEDQAVKYLVRDKIVEFLTHTVAECETKEEAMEKIGEKLVEAAEVADGVLRENGFYYGARASLKKEEFPTRVYENVTLNAGVYDALIVELGGGKGDNWWCVVYPPLCFGGGNVSIIYKSKIAEIVRNFFNR